MSYVYEAVERIPSKMREGVVYHTEEFELAGLLCACGCGHRVTLLVPDSHQVWEQNGMATVRPSIGVFDAPCKSHYFITAGQVQWLPSFSGAEAGAIMHAQIARHVAQEEAKPWAWFGRMMKVLANAFGRLKAFLSGRR